jgi:hypothetical protein
MLLMGGSITQNVDLEIAMPHGFEQSFYPSIDDRVLAEIAVKIQLPPSAYAKVVQRYNTLAQFVENAWADRHGEVSVRPQGSVRIGATISVRDDKGHDVDATIDVTDFKSYYSSPADVLDDLFETFRASDRYRNMVTRNTRCVTIQYEDGMHVDLTPWVNRSRRDHEGCVMHHRTENRSFDPNGRLVESSPELFARAFESRMPTDTAFREEYLRKSMEADRLGFGGLLLKEAEPLPDQQVVFEKPRALIALQLIKRHRNLRYQKRDGRKPPSILLSELVAETAGTVGVGGGLTEELIRIVRYIATTFDMADSMGTLISRDNPVDRMEKLTDRWPQNSTDQDLYRADLSDFLKAKKTILADLFGEIVSSNVIEEITDSVGDSISENRQPIVSGGLGSLLVADGFGRGVGTGSLPTGLMEPRPKKFYGDDIQDN